MPAITTVGNVAILQNMYNNMNFWFGVGQTDPWPNDNNPPAESVSTTMINEIQGLTQVSLIQFVVPSATGTINFQGVNYAPVTLTDIYNVGATYLYFSAWLLFSNFPVVTFRQTGLFAGVVPSAGYAGNTVLLPTQVQSYGTMIGYVNHQPRVRTAYGKDLIEFIVNMQAQVTPLS